MKPSFSNYSPPVKKERLKEVWMELNKSPVMSSVGIVYQFAPDPDEKLMEETIFLLSQVGGTENWRAADNSEITLDATGLAALMDDLRLRRGIRGSVLNQEYLAMKAGYSADPVVEVTKKQLSDWCAQYANGYIPLLP